MGGIIRGFLGGAGKGMADVGKMYLANQLKKESTEADALKAGELQKSKQAFERGENKLDREARSADIRAKSAASAKDNRTNQQKNSEALKAEGYPKDIANGIAHGALKQITDKETGDIILVNATNNEPVGSLTSSGGKGPKVWLPEGEQPTNDARVSKKHREAGAKAADEKAGYFSLDSTDFPVEKSEKEYAKKEAQRLANEERGSGIINSQAAPASKEKSKTPYPEGTKLKGKDGMIYVVKNGKPVLSEKQ